MRKLIGSAVLMAAMMLVPGVRSAEALDINWLQANGLVTFGNQTSTSQILTAISGILGSATEIYKQDVGGGESGKFAGSYHTVFSNTAGDPTDADIIFDGGLYINTASPTYLLIKDGDQSPAWLLYSLTALAWNGTDTININGFWPNQGAISHVAIYGSTVGLPEPATLSLLGLGVLTLGASRRRSGQVAKV